MPSFSSLLAQQAVRDFLDELDAPIYCTTLEKGNFIFANPAMSKLVGYTVQELQSHQFSARSLYLRETDRDDWAQFVRRGNGLVARTVELVRNPTTDVHDRLFVVDLAVVRDKEVLGILGDVSEQEFERELLVNRIAAYRAILNLPWVNVGIHEIDHEGFIISMNKREMNLLGIVSADVRRHVVELSGPGENLGKKHRVKRKLLGICPLTAGEHRRFYNQQNEEWVQVNIHDFAVAEPDPIRERRWHRELITAVRDEESHVASILKQLLPQNPILQELFIYTFTKALRPYASEFNENIPEEVKQEGHESDLIFTFANKLFIGELKKSTGRGGAKIEKMDDVIGKTDVDLFPEYAASFSRADRDVLELNAKDERIEKHPSADGGPPIDVQVVKIPLYLPDDTAQQRPVGVQGFYWLVSERDMHQQLTKMYEPWNILDTIAVPVYRKNRALRFTYANNKYLEDVREISKKRQIKTLSDIIGNTDQDIFDDDLARSYENDDLAVIETKKVVDHLEPHGEVLVRVIKTPIIHKIRDNKGQEVETVIGIQGIFWEPKPEEQRPPIWIDWLNGILHVFGEEPKRIGDPDQGVWKLFQLLTNNLNKLVTYDTIGEKVFGRPNATEDKHTRDEIKSYRIKLKNVLTSHGLGHRFTIEGDAKNAGYKMKFQLDPHSKKQDIPNGDTT